MNFIGNFCGGRRRLMVAVVAVLLAAMTPQGSVAARPDIERRQNQLEDISVFRHEFLAVDRAYTPALRVEAERRLAALERAAGRTTAMAFNVALCQIVALADNGHSTCSAQADSVGLSFSPIGDGYYVVKATTENADLLGSRLLAVDGRALQRIRSAIHSMAGGVAAHRDLLAAPVLAKPGLLNALEAATYRLLARDGRVVERQLGIAARPANWTSLQAENAPWAAQALNEPFRWRDAPELDAVVIQLRLNLNLGGRKVAAFLDEAEAARERLGRTHIVLDMRWNIGGDFLQTRDFLLAWPQRLSPPGRFFVLIGPATFSAGIASVAYLKQAGRDRVVLIGEPVGDRLMFFAENMTPIHLPHSKVVLLAALQRNDFQDGCRHYEDCIVVLAQPDAAHATPPDKAAILDALYGRKPLHVDHLAPDITAPWTMQTYLAGRDPALEAVAATIHQTRQSSDELFGSSLQRTTQ